MVKYMGIWSLKPGFDPDETFRLWREKHTVWSKAKLLPEAKKYTIARVIDTLGQTDIYGMSQIVFEDVESARRALNRVFSSPPDEFMAERVTNIRKIIVQEEEIEL